MRALVSLLGLVAVAAAQDLTPKAAAQSGPVALVGGRVHTVSGEDLDGGAYVLFDRGTIVDVGTGARAWPGATTVIDVSGRHVYPGLISPVSQLGLTEIGAVRASRDFDEVGAVTPEVRAAVAVNPDSTLLPVTRRNGILTFAAFPRGGAIPGCMSVMGMDGWTWEDMAILQDGGLVVAWPAGRHARGQRQRRDPKQADHAAETRLLIRQAFSDARAYLDARDADPAVPTDVRHEAMRAALERRRPVFFLADEHDQIVESLAFAMECGLRPVIVGGRDAAPVVDLIARAGGSVIVDSVHAFPKRADSDFDALYRLPGRLEAAGVPWCLASGDRTANERNLPYAAGRAAAYGLSRAAALRAVTLYPARILGVADRLGSIEKGKRATLIVTDGDPLEIPTHVKMAWIDGRRIDLSSKQSELHEKYREKYRQLGLLR